MNGFLGELLYIFGLFLQVVSSFAQVIPILFFWRALQTGSPHSTSATLGAIIFPSASAAPALMLACLFLFIHLPLIPFLLHTGPDFPTFAALGTVSVVSPLGTVVYIHVSLSGPFSIFLIFSGLFSEIIIFWLGSFIVVLASRSLPRPVVIQMCSTPSVLEVVFEIAVALVSRVTSSLVVI